MRGRRPHCLFLVAAVELIARGEPVQVRPLGARAGNGVECPIIIRVLSGYSNRRRWSTNVDSPAIDRLTVDLQYKPETWIFYMGKVNVGKSKGAGRMPS
jgi:hypothetical protein